jgi:hypothetical protein
MGREGNADLGEPETAGLGAGAVRDKAIAQTVVHVDPGEVEQTRTQKPG